MKLRSTLSNNRGLATSIIEVTLVIAITATLASVAASGFAKLDDANSIRAGRDTELIAMAMLGFMQDTGVPPAFKSGLAALPTDEIFFVLESEGEDVDDETDSWPTDPDEIDLLENHLVKNQPDLIAPGYLRVGEISFNRQKGWNGPYLSRRPDSDPWGDKYLANVQFLTPQGEDLASLEVPTGGRLAVVVLSAGPNRTIETEFEQLNDSFEAGGDDIVFRIQ